MDLGGQRPERAKWDRIIADGCKAVFYFVAVDEYDTPTVEDKNKTKLEVSLQTWKDLLKNPQLANVSIILLLNKIDLLEKHLESGFDSVTARFPKYSGAKTKEGFLKYVQQMYIDCIPQSINLDYVSCLNCCALDTKLMGSLFNEARSHILQRSLSTL